MCVLTGLAMSDYGTEVVRPEPHTCIGILRLLIGRRAAINRSKIPPPSVTLV